MTENSKDLKLRLNLDVWEDIEPSSKNVVSAVASENNKNDDDDIFSSALNHYEPNRKSNIQQPTTVKGKTTGKIPMKTVESTQTNAPSKRKKKTKNVKVSIKVERDDKFSEYDAYF